MGPWIDKYYLQTLASIQGCRKILLDFINDPLHITFFGSVNKDLMSFDYLTQFVSYLPYRSWKHKCVIPEDDNGD